MRALSIPLYPIERSNLQDENPSPPKKTRHSSKIILSFLLITLLPYSTSYKDLLLCTTLKGTSGC